MKYFTVISKIYRFIYVRFYILFQHSWTKNDFVLYNTYCTIRIVQYEIVSDLRVLEQDICFISSWPIYCSDSLIWAVFPALVNPKQDYQILECKYLVETCSTKWRHIHTNWGHCIEYNPHDENLIGSDIVHTDRKPSLFSIVFNFNSR